MAFTVSLAQMSVTAGNIEANFQKGKALVAAAAERGADLVVLPELWTTGFDWPRNKELSDKHNGILEEIAVLAREHRLWIHGSTLTVEEQQLFNTSTLYDSDGIERGRYSKIHLFRYGGENKYLAAGDAPVIVETPWGKMGLAICYDLRFPELFRRYALEGATMVLLPAAFPQPRRPHWNVLLRARAIENQMFVIATNHVGEAEFPNVGPVTFFGTSAVIDPWGETVVEGGQDEEILLTTTVDLEAVQRARRKMQVLEDRRPEVYPL